MSTVKERAEHLAVVMAKVLSESGLAIEIPAGKPGHLVGIAETLEAIANRLRDIDLETPAPCPCGKLIHVKYEDFMMGSCPICRQDEEREFIDMQDPRVIIEQERAKLAPGVTVSDEMLLRVYKSKQPKEVLDYCEDCGHQRHNTGTYCEVCGHPQWEEK